MRKYTFLSLPIFVWIAKMCEVYGMVGSLVGCTSIWTMTYIAFDRYNVIVKGLSAKPMTNGGAVLRIAFIWAHALLWTLAPMFGWNRYVPEGNMTACGTDYLTKDWFSRSYILVYSFFVYFLPLFMIIYSYWFIVKVTYTTFFLSSLLQMFIRIMILNWFLFSVGCLCSREKYARTGEKNECCLVAFIGGSKY